MNRRKFLTTTTAASTLLLLKPKTVFGYQANSAVRIGLLGCGNRGTRVASVFASHPTARIVALGDIFPDKLLRGKTHFDQLNATLNHPAIDPRLTFHGHDAYLALTSSKDVDMVQISTPPIFHVQHLAASVDAGKHTYCEKPVGVDIPQTITALEIANRVKGKLSVDVGFEVRNAPPIAAIIERIHSGALGKTAAGTGWYYAPAAAEKPSPSPTHDDQWRLRNWILFRALSGDILVEQNIHIIDLCNWGLNAHPIAATATGGRTVLTTPGDIYDNYQVDFTYPGGIHLSFASTQFGNGAFAAGLSLFGADGTADLPYSGPIRITGKTPWTYSEESPATASSSASASGSRSTSTSHSGSGSNSASSSSANNQKFAANGDFTDNLRYADRDKTGSFLESITSGKYHNQIAAGVESARSCMLGRQAAYTSKPVTWNELLTNKEKYNLDMDLSKFS
jgi:myo-inositol 2-dehydrogenase/D-chiro-inositol 1-dehydrogenase